MNGIDHVAQLRSRYEHVVAGAMHVESERGTDWVVVQKTPFIRVELGPGEEIAEELRAAGIDATVREDEAGVLWEKLAFLAPVALTTSALGGPIGDVRDDPWWRARLEGAQPVSKGSQVKRRERRPTGCSAGAGWRYPAARAPVAQWIEQRFPKPRALVRFRPGALVNSL